nr:MAG TPA: hypothetical protein [Caudoviricetes sp.]
MFIKDDALPKFQHQMTRNKDSNSVRITASVTLFTQMEIDENALSLLTYEQTKQLYSELDKRLTKEVLQFVNDLTKNKR